MLRKQINKIKDARTTNSLSRGSVAVQPDSVIVNDAFIYHCKSFLNSVNSPSSGTHGCHSLTGVLGALPLSSRAMHHGRCSQPPVSASIAS